MYPVLNYTNYTESLGFLLLRSDVHCISILLLAFIYMEYLSDFMNNICLKVVNINTLY